MTEAAPASLAQAVAALALATPMAARAAAWEEMSRALAAAGRRDQALLAARTASALHERVDASADLLRTSRRAVESLSGPDVVPLHVDVPVGEHDSGPEARDAARAVWLGAPGATVLAMLGWVERDGAIDVVRVVVPGTRRGRSAFSLLLAALPDVVPVTLRLPARDATLGRLCSRAGFAEVAGSRTQRGHLGGSVQVHRPAVVPRGAQPSRR